MMRGRLRWMASQIAVRPSTHLPNPEMVLIGLADLPPGWKLTDQRRWRSGQGRDQEWAARARALGSVTAWRSFASPTRDRWLWAQTTALASVEDAQHALDQVWEHRLANLRARLQVTARQNGPPLAIPAERVLTRQERTSGPSGDGVTRYLAWAYRGMVSVMAGSGPGDAWAWPDLAVLATAQSHRIDTIAGHVT
jgi:hypothetical protein